MLTIREKVLQAIDETQKNLYERDELAKLIWLTIGADLNLLMLGDPGTAKTMMAVNLTKTIAGAKIFHYTLNSFTTIDELFGHFDLLELKNNNKLKRNITNKLLDCHVAYLDEFFKSNSGTLNALLDVMNEKVYIDSYGKVELPLKFLISSSNELPSEEDNLAAVLDRFQVKYLVRSIQDHSVRIGAYMKNGLNLDKIEQPITINDINEYREKVDKIEYTREVAEMTEKIYQNLIKEGIYISDRTVFRTIPLVKAQAFLSGRDKVDSTDLIVLKDVFWTELSEQAAVKKVVFELANPLYGKVEEEWEAIQLTIEEKEKEIKNASKDDLSKASNLSFELIKKIRKAANNIQKYVDLMEKSNTDTRDAKVKLTGLTSKVKALFEEGNLE